jgi:hypothetical protein
VIEFGPLSGEGSAYAVIDPNEVKLSLSRRGAEPAEHMVSEVPEPVVVLSLTPLDDEAV